jgi:hypothetical protein
MNVKYIGCCALAMSAAVVGTLRGQPPVGAYDSTAPRPAVQGQAVAPLPMQQSAGLSDWMLYRRHDCCVGPLGDDPPIGNEFYLRVGPNFATGGRLGNVLETGWTIQGGVRALCYNKPQTAAWVVDASLSNHNNDGNRPDVPFTLNFVDGSSKQVTVSGYNRTFVGLGAGREWYLGGALKESGHTWRLGVDGGGRYGSAKCDFNQLRHRTDVIGGVYVGGYADFELPCSDCCVFFAGIRTEWSYSWSDILQQQSDVEDVGLLFTVGVNY